MGPRASGPDAALGHFAALIRHYREEAGFDTAREFYNAQGGRPFFGCTYKAYLNVEKAVSVPQPRLVERLATGLRVALKEDRARALALAYLRILVGWDEFFEFAVQTLADKGPAAAPASALESYEERLRPLTPRQSALLVASPENYWSFTVLANEVSSRSPEELAELLGFPAVKVRASLEALARLGLLERAKDGRYRCPEAGRVFLHPKEDPYVPRVLETLQGLWDAMARSASPGARDEILMEHPVLMRASESELKNYYQYLIQSVQGADLYTRTTAGPDTAFFAIEAKVLKILPC